MSSNLHFGTCSWKHPGWSGALYSLFAQPEDCLNRLEGCAPPTLERLKARGSRAG